MPAPLASPEVEDALIPLSALQHQLFCPRQCALIHVEGLWAEDGATAEGRLLHERVDAGRPERRPGVRIVRSLSLRSLALGVSGIADVVEFQGRPAQPFPVEYKRGKPKTHRADEVQLCAQAICLEEMFGQDVPAGALFYGETRRRHDVVFDDALRALTSETARAARRNIADSRTPLPVKTPACRRCSLATLCQPDRLEKPPQMALLQSWSPCVGMGSARRQWVMSDFKGRHFEGEIVLWAVRWYCRYGVSYRDLEQMMGERGVLVDHSTIYRWVQRYAPEIEKRLRWQWRGPRSTSWRVDETYVKVRGQWAYLYRALDKHGNTIEFYLSPTRNTAAAKRFLGKALKGLKNWEKPYVINTDKAPTYAAALAELKAQGKCPHDTVHRQVKYLNNVIEADHGKLKQLIRPVRGFKTLKTAYATIKGFEVMRALRKGQASAFNLTGDIRGEARIVERAFGLGASALGEAAHLLNQRVQLEAA